MYSKNNDPQDCGFLMEAEPSWNKRTRKALIVKQIVFSSVFSLFKQQNMDICIGASVLTMAGKSQILMWLT